MRKILDANAKGAGNLFAGDEKRALVGFLLGGAVGCGAFSGGHKTSKVCSAFWELAAVDLGGSFFGCLNEIRRAIN